MITCYNKRLSFITGGPYKRDLLYKESTKERKGESIIILCRFMNSILSILLHNSSGDFILPILIQNNATFLIHFMKPVI